MITELDEKTALILIDLQKGVVGLTLAHPVADVLANVVKLVNAFRNARLPIVIVNVNPAGAKWSTARKDAKPNTRAFNEDWIEIVPEVKTSEDDIFITKHTWNAFYETALHIELQKRGITGIVLAGVSTSIGVEGTARNASEHGYNLSFATDAMTDMVAEAHERSLKHIFPRIGETGTTEEIIAKLS